MFDLSRKINIHKTKLVDKKSANIEKNSKICQKSVDIIKNMWYNIEVKIKAPPQSLICLGNKLSFVIRQMLPTSEWLSENAIFVCVKATFL